MIYAMTYYTKDYAGAGQYNLKSALNKGKVDKIIELTEKDIPSDFRKKNSRILSIKKGAGLWLWKPYSVCAALDMIEMGDFLIYSDAATYFVRDIHPLIDEMESDISVFEMPYIEKEYTKKGVFEALGAKEKDKLSNQITGSYIIFKKSRNSLKFVNQWLSYCEKEELMIDNPNDDVINRYDQSILSVLSKTWGIRPKTDISQNSYGKKRKLGQRVYIMRHREKNVTFKVRAKVCCKYLLSYFAGR